MPVPVLGLHDQGSRADAHAGRAPDFAAGEALYWAPGHAAEGLEDSQYVDFSPSEQFQPVIDHITSGGAAPA